MDREYREHISESPYIAEGAFDSLKKAATQIGNTKFGQAFKQGYSQSKPGENEKEIADDWGKTLDLIINIISSTVMNDEEHAQHYFSKPMAGGKYYLPKSDDEPMPTEPAARYVNPQQKMDAAIAAGNESEAKKWRDIFTKGGYYEYDPASQTYSYVKPKSKPATTIKFPDVKKDIDEDTRPEEEDDEDPTGGRRSSDDDKKGEVDDSETGYFVYDFASRYNKYPGHGSIAITEPGGFEIYIGKDGSKKRVIELFWSWKKGYNTITVKYSSEGKQFDVFGFYDYEVIPTEPGYNPSIKILMDNVDKKFSALLQKCDNGIKKKIMEDENRLFPALYAVIRRKSMEFKAYRQWVLEVPTECREKIVDGEPNPYYGGVRVARGPKKGRTLTLDQVRSLYHSSDDDERKKWRAALDGIEKGKGYFNIFKDLEKQFTSKNPEDAVLALISLGMKKADAQAAVDKVVAAHGAEHPVEFYTKAALPKSPEKPVSESMKLSDLIIRYKSNII